MKKEYDEFYDIWCLSSDQVIIELLNIYMFTLQQPRVYYCKNVHNLQEFIDKFKQRLTTYERKKFMNHLNWLGIPLYEDLVCKDD